MTVLWAEVFIISTALVKFPGSSIYNAPFSLICSAVELYKKFTRSFSATWERILLDTHKLSLSAVQATEQIRVAADMASTKIEKTEGE